MAQHTLKILAFDDLVERVKDHQKNGKIVVQSHGIFDLIHPGVISHLNSAKGQGDILVVTVIRDRDVKRASRPIFPEQQRVENVASLCQVDYACIVEDDIPFRCVERLKPDVFAKGQLYKDRDQRIHQSIFREEKDILFGKSRIFETPGFSFSSSTIINNFLDIYPDETKVFLRNFAQKYTFNAIADKINSLKNLNVLLIGDGIIDEYHYCFPLGKSAKAHLVVNKYLSHESFAGGAFAIANHTAGICNKVHLVTLLGADDSQEDFIVDNLKPNVSTKFFYRDDGPTIVKKRYINQYLNQKLFEVNYLNDRFISQQLEENVLEYLRHIAPEYDLILVSDFGHGLITKRIISAIESFPKKIAVNTQINGANSGYNLITKYHKPHFICLDEPEARLATQVKFGDIEEVAAKLLHDLRVDNLIITLGRNGSIGFDGTNTVKNRTPIFSSKVIDTVGAGDAFFAFTAPCLAQNMPLDMVSFIGNAVGALAVQIVGNKRPVEKHELLEFIYALLK